MGVQVTPMTLFNLNYLFKGLISKYSDILWYWGVELQHMNLWGAHNSAHNEAYKGKHGMRKRGVLLGIHQCGH